jgi:hypothetical protein
MLLRSLAHHEKGTSHLVPLQDFKKAGRVLRMGTVVEGQSSGGDLSHHVAKAA